ncbi:hypothetical protein LTR50_003281 [Elasticomyces elasticus]|nr:hypothetical protein LTR50_003281 [Elasticomyces elasticus]
MAPSDLGDDGSSGSNGSTYAGYQDSCSRCGLSHCMCHYLAGLMTTRPPSPQAQDEASDLLSPIERPQVRAPAHLDHGTEKQPSPYHIPEEQVGPYYVHQRQQPDSKYIAALKSNAVRQLQGDRACIDPSVLQAFVHGPYTPGDHEYPSEMQDIEPVARQGEQPRPQSYEHVSSATSTHHGCGSNSHPAFSDTVPTSHTAGSRQDQTNLDPMEGFSTASAPQ